MKKLTKIQKKVLEKMEIGKELSAYQLQVSLATLIVLAKNGFLQRTKISKRWSSRAENKFVRIK